MNGTSEIETMKIESDPIDCANVVELLCAYEDRELPPSLLTRIESHLDQCACCREVKMGYSLVVELAKELDDEPLAPGIQNRLRKALNRRLHINLPLITD